MALKLFLKLIGAIVIICGVMSPATAAWHRATSRHFVIYADERPETLKQRAQNLEMIDAGLRLLHRMGDSGDDAVNPVTIFVTRDLAELRRVFGNPQAPVAGFYIPRPDGAVAFTPADSDGGGRMGLSPRIVLYHEYGHHFLLGNYGAAYPAWFSEGYAEFVSTMKVDRGQLVVGIAAAHRANSIFFGDVLSLEQVFAPPAKMTGEQRESIYSRGWLMTHYLLMDPAREQQLERYLRAVNNGTPSLDAAKAAFGDLRAMEAAMNKYVMQHKLPARGAPLADLAIGPIEVRALTPGEAAMVPTRMLAVRGTNDKTAPGLLAAGNAVASRFPNDPVVQGWLAEMAYDANQDALAEQAADRALAANAGDVIALLAKARVHMRRAEKTPVGQAEWQTIRSYIIRANKAANNNPSALALFYSSYPASGQRPNQNAIAALERALQLGPQARGTRLMLVRQYVLDGKTAEARRTLLPLANNPHANADSPAKKLLAAIDAKADPQTMRKLFEAEDAADDGPGEPPGGDGKGKPNGKDKTDK